MFVDDRVMITVKTFKGRMFLCVWCLFIVGTGPHSFGHVITFLWANGGTHRGSMWAQGSGRSELAALCSPCLERPSIWLSFRFSVVYFHFTEMR